MHMDSNTKTHTINTLTVHSPYDFPYICQYVLHMHMYFKFWSVYIGTHVCGPVRINADRTYKQTATYGFKNHAYIKLN